MKPKKPQAKSKKLEFTFEGSGGAYYGGALEHGRRQTGSDRTTRYMCGEWRKFLRLPANGVYRLTVTIKRVKGGSR